MLLLQFEGHEPKKQIFRRFNYNTTDHIATKYCNQNSNRSTWYVCMKITVKPTKSFQKDGGGSRVTNKE
jgi:hypothetical protein